MHFQQLTELMSTLGVAQNEDLVGVPLPEIQAMEAFFGLRFPVSYVHFLHRCGRSAGHLSGWAAIYFDDLKEIAEEFEFHKTMLNSELLLPGNGLLIAHYNQSFDYMICDGTAEPAIYRITFCDGNAHCERFAKTHADYLEAMIRRAGKEKGRIEPFFIDDCGNMMKDDLTTLAPVVE
jgi:hypothetical protein